MLLFESDDEDKNEVVNELEDWSKVEYVYSYESYDRSWSLYLGLPRLVTSNCALFSNGELALWPISEWFWGSTHLDMRVVVAGSHAALVLCNMLTPMMLLKPSTRWMVGFFLGESWLLCLPRKTGKSLRDEISRAYQVNIHASFFSHTRDLHPDFSMHRLSRSSSRYSRSRSYSRSPSPRSWRYSRSVCNSLEH